MLTKNWNRDELVVLFAFYRRKALAVLDDSHITSQAIAAEFGRTASAVDRQARNMDDVVRGRKIQHVGQLAIAVAQAYGANDLGLLYQEANAAIQRNQWGLPRF